MAELGQQEIEAYLGEPHVANLTTVRPGGGPHVAPVWFLWEAGRVYVIAGNTAVKVRNIRANPAVALSVAAETRKPIVVLKTGQSAAGAAAARAHTAADAGDDARFSEMFERSGVYRARTIEELIDVAGACAANAFPNGRRAGLMTISGGVGVVMADAAVRAGLDVAPMPVPVERELKALLPFAAARNPIDCTAQAFNDWSLFDRFLDAVVRRGGYDSIVLFLATVGANPAVMDPLMDRLEAIRAAHHDRVMAVSLIIDDERRRRLERAGFLVFEDPTRAVNTVAALAHIGDHLFRRRSGATRGAGE